MLLLRVLFLAPMLLHAQPGELLPSAFAMPSSHALVHATAIADDCSTFLSGDFTEVDGIACPGIAKLSPSGILDLSFSPAATASNDLYLLPTGQLMALASNSWTLLNPNGSPNTDLLADIPRSSNPRPQFHTADHLYLIVGSSLRAYHAVDLALDTSFVSPVTTHPPYQVVPAADSKLWLLTRSPSQPSPLYYISDFSHTLLRLLENGAVDPTFLPVELPADHAYSLEPAPSGGFRLIGEWLGRYLFWPRATNRAFTADRYSPSGEKIATQSYAAPFSWIGGALFQEPDLTIYPALDSTRLVRRQALDRLPQAETHELDSELARSPELAAELRATEDAITSVWHAVSPLHPAPAGTLDSIHAKLHPVRSRPALPIVLAVLGWAAAITLALLLFSRPHEARPAVANNSNSPDEPPSNTSTPDIPSRPGKPLSDPDSQRDTIRRLREELATLRAQKSGPRIRELRAPGDTSRRQPSDRNRALLELLTAALGDNLARQSESPATLVHIPKKTDGTNNGDWRQATGASH